MNAKKLASFVFVFVLLLTDCGKEQEGETQEVEGQTASIIDTNPTEEPVVADGSITHCSWAKYSNIVQNGTDNLDYTDHCELVALGMHIVIDNDGQDMLRLLGHPDSVYYDQALAFIRGLPGQEGWPYGPAFYQGSGAQNLWEIAESVQCEAFLLSNKANSRTQLGAIYTGPTTTGEYFAFTSWWVESDEPDFAGTFVLLNLGEGSGGLDGPTWEDRSGFEGAFKNLYGISPQGGVTYLAEEEIYVVSPCFK